MKKAIIIGGGVGGLATAIRLAAKNVNSGADQQYSVTLFEKNNEVGGKLAEFSQNGFRFDMGPSLFTMPEYFEDLFQSAERNLEDYLSYKKLDKSCTYFFADGKSFVFYNDKEKLIREAKEKLGLSAEPIIKYLQESEKMYNGAGKLFIENSLHKLGTFFSVQALRSLPTLMNPANLKSLHEKNLKNLKAEKWVQLFDRYATYNGSSPYKTPAMMAIIPHLEHNIGTFFPKGGMFGIIKAMEKLATELGVKIEKGVQVENLNLKGKIIESVVVGEKTVKADLIVSNMDIALVYKNLLNDPIKFKKEIKKERSSSGLVFYWGVKNTFPELSLHNILFSGDYKKEFDQIFNQKEWPTEPTVYINISSKEELSDAPNGCENWFVMINTPAGINLGKEAIKVIRTIIIKIVSQRIPRFEKSDIIAERVLTPSDINERTLSMQGALYGTASNSTMSSFTRHPNFKKHYKNLFFVGGTVHPGGGIPLCLNSAKIVVDSL
ncbi:MAG: 1-hydroxycarotenoid 3,4-desaturase CrtD [Crocinitomicaceae bacterium]